MALNKLTKFTNVLNDPSRNNKLIGFDVNGNPTTTLNPAPGSDTYDTVEDGLSNTPGDGFFFVANPDEKTILRLYRKVSNQAVVISDYPSKIYVDSEVERKSKATTRLNRSLQRLGDHGQTIHSDFNLNAYGLGTIKSQGVEDALEAEELWDVNRASSTYVLEKDGKYREVPPNEIAREWNPETSQYQAQISGAATNKLPSSENVYGSSWRLSSFTSGSDSPFATQGFSGVRFVVSGGRRFYEQPITLPAGTYCISTLTEIFGETPTHAVAYFTGAFSSSRVYATSGSRRSSAVFTLAADTSGVIRWGVGTENTETANCDIAMAAIQLVQGTSPGPVIPTQDAPVMRAADNISRQLGAEFNASEGTLIVEFSDVSSVSSFGYIFSISDGTTQNLIGMYKRSDDAYRIVVFRDGSDVFATVSADVRASGVNRVAISWGNGSVIGCVNGGNVYGISVTPRQLTTLFMSGLNNNSSFRVSAKYGLQKIIPYALTADQLQELTQL